MTYRKPDIYGMTGLRLAHADLMLRFTDDPKRPIALVTPNGEVPLFMEAMDELWVMLAQFAKRVQRAAEKQGVCVFADHGAECGCKSKVPE